MNNLALGSGLMCAAMLVLGMSMTPLSASLAGLCELLAVASGVVFVGLVEDR
jgi:hypothetical protein